MKETARIICGLIAAGAVTFGFFYRPENEVKNRTDGIWLLCLLIAGIALLGMFWAGRSLFQSKKILNPEEKLKHYIQRVSSVLIVGFLLISLQLVRNTVVIADELKQPYNGVNAKGQAVSSQDPRITNSQSKRQRGRIFDANNGEIAGIKVDKDGYVARTYTSNSAARQLLGYYSPLQFGNSGLEENFNNYLNGDIGANPLLTLRDELVHKPTIGNDLYLTIDPKLQQLAVTQLGNLSGAIVLLDAKTGAVLAMAGYPNFDPAQLAFDPTLAEKDWPAQFDKISKSWQALATDPTSPLLPRATQGVYIPGSIFKTFTLAAGLDSGKITPDKVWNDTGTLTVDGRVINDPNRPDRNKTEWTTREGYMFSLNSVFAQMGLELGAPLLQQYGEKFGLDKPIPFDIATARSRLYVDNGYLLNRVAQADTGFGQGQLLLNPLHLALIAASFGRGDGVMPTPYLVQTIKARDGTVIKNTQPRNWLQTVRPETVQQVRDIMVASATNGYVGINGGGLKDTGALVGGKTGTAELGGGLTNATYIAWASKGERTFAISVVINGGRGWDGLAFAMPRANQILRAALANVK